MTERQLKVVRVDRGGNRTVMAEEAQELSKFNALLLGSDAASEEEIIEAAKDADVILTSAAQMTRRVLQALPKCQAIVRYGIGFDTIDVDAATDLGILVVNIPDYCINEVSNQAIALLLACANKLVLLNNMTKEGHWFETYRRMIQPPMGLIAGQTLGFKIDKKADYVIVTGCFNPEGMPPAFQAFKALLDYLKINYTLLSKEYCCGWMPLGQRAVMDKNQDDISRSKELSREFVQLNFQQAEALGAKAIVRFCAACEPTYTNYAKDTKLELISYSELLDRYFTNGRLEADIDYYAGCYRFRRRITNEPVDLSPSSSLLNKIAGLRVNYLDNNLCCYIPPHLKQLTESFKTTTIVTICSGCYGNIKRTLTGNGKYNVKMQPEILWDSVNNIKNL